MLRWRDRGCCVVFCGLVCLLLAVGAGATGTSSGSTVSHAARSSTPTNYPDSTTDSQGLGLVSAAVSNNNSLVSFSITYGGRTGGNFVAGDSIGVFLRSVADSKDFYNIAGFSTGNGQVAYSDGTSYASVDNSGLTVSDFTSQPDGTGVFSFTLDLTKLTKIQFGRSLTFRIGAWENGKTAGSDVSDLLPDSGQDTYTLAATTTPATTPAASTTPLQTDWAAKDTDHDGIRNGSDDCPDEAAGYDPNHNGCPGPYSQIHADLVVPSSPQNGYVYLQSWTVAGQPKSKPTEGLPAGTTYSCIADNHSQCKWFGKWSVAGGYDRIYYHDPKRFAPGTTFTLYLAKDHYIGRAWTLTTARAGSKTTVFISHARCIEPTPGLKIVDCKSVSHGS